MNLIHVNIWFSLKIVYARHGYVSMQQRWQMKLSYFCNKACFVKHGWAIWELTTLHAKEYEYSWTNYLEWILWLFHFSPQYERHQGLLVFFFLLVNQPRCVHRLRSSHSKTLQPIREVLVTKNLNDRKCSAFWSQKLLQDNPSLQNPREALSSLQSFMGFAFKCKSVNV